MQREAGSLPGWRAGGLAGWLAGWLVGWFPFVADDMVRFVVVRAVVPVNLSNKLP